MDREGPNGNIYALSPKCKHLGCVRELGAGRTGTERYFCPCHGARYTIDGKKLAVASAPLDEYEVNSRRFRVSRSD